MSVCMEFLVSTFIFHFKRNIAKFSKKKGYAMINTEATARVLHLSKTSRFLHVLVSIAIVSLWKVQYISVPSFIIKGAVYASISCQSQATCVGPIFSIHHQSATIIRGHCRIRYITRPHCTMHATFILSLVERA